MTANSDCAEPVLPVMYKVVPSGLTASPLTPAARPFGMYWLAHNCLPVRAS
jgi:hypothetical protein